MIIYNARLGGSLCSIETRGGVIVAVGKNRRSGDIDAGGKRVIPGMIDIHTHGRGGRDTMDADFEPMCRDYAAAGTTSLLATTMTVPADDIRRVCEAKTDFAGAQILGFHLEGPYISPKKKGAQDERNIARPSVEEFQTFSHVKMITVAPEAEGCMDFISEISGRCSVSIGHTDCDYETALEAIRRGANCLTHTFNAMPPFSHRAPGPIGAGFERQIYAQLICDGLHVSKPAVLMIYRLFGAKRTVLISDSIRPAGMPEGVYDCGGLPVTLKDGVARLADGTIAGSVASLFDCVKKAVEFGIPFDDAVTMATKTPAELLGVKKGVIAAGFDADMLIIDEDMNITDVIIAGKRFVG